MRPSREQLERIILDAGGYWRNGELAGVHDGLGPLWDAGYAAGQEAERLAAIQACERIMGKHKNGMVLAQKAGAAADWECETDLMLGAEECRDAISALAPAAPGEPAGNPTAGGG